MSLLAKTRIWKKKIYKQFYSIIIPLLLEFFSLSRKISEYFCRPSGRVSDPPFPYHANNRKFWKSLITAYICRFARFLINIPHMTSAECCKYFHSQFFVTEFIFLTFIPALMHWTCSFKAGKSQTTFSNTFSSMTMFEFRLKFHRSLFLKVQMTISQHWLR